MGFWRNRAVPITPFVAGREFQPELIQTMSGVLLRVPARLGLSDRADPFTEMVAVKVIELARRGILDPDALFERTLREFNVPKQHAPD